MGDNQLSLHSCRPIMLLPFRVLPIHQVKCRRNITKQGHWLCVAHLIPGNSNHEIGNLWAVFILYRILIIWRTWTFSCMTDGDMDFSCAKNSNTYDLIKSNALETSKCIQTLREPCGSLDQSWSDNLVIFVNT